VQLIVATRDRYISTAMYDDAADWAPHIWRRDLRAGHWVPRSHPRAVARAISELVDHVEGGPEAAPLRRARFSGSRRDLEGRLAVVTGGGSGIGRATVLALAEAGAEVIAADINLDSAQATAGEAELIHATRVDVGDVGAMEAFAAEVESEYGVPAIVVNNAGIGIGGPFLDTTLADWERIVDVNLWGVIHGCRLFARQMVEAGVEGQILNTASMAAYTPSRLSPAPPTSSAYRPRRSGGARSRRRAPTAGAATRPIGWPRRSCAPSAGTRRCSQWRRKRTWHGRSRGSRRRSCEVSGGSTWTERFDEHRKPLRRSLIRLDLARL
jgi:NAD(P)-dependent dehydrogenase (short-subunit alcohol dehydrogenase family)